VEITINGETINFELEQEKNANDIVTGISEYLSAQEPQQFITSILINGKETSYANESALKKHSLESISRIDFEATDIFGITVLSIHQIEKFLGVLNDIILSKEWDEGFLKIHDSMDWMKDGINQIISIFGSRNPVLLSEKDTFIKAYEKLKIFFISISKNSYPFNPEDQKTALDLNRIMQESLDKVKSSLKATDHLFDSKTIEENIAVLIDEIDELLPRLASVPLLFQTGSDQESMEIIQKLAAILEKSISLFVIFKESFKVYLDKYTVKEVPFEEFFHALTEQLKELMSSIENNDSVMIGDLLEYEFVPNVEEIKNILIRIKKEAFVKAN
jgi:hypothetical protein